MNQVHGNSIALGVYTWAKKLFAFMTMSGLLTNLQDALTRVVVCVIPIHRITGYLSGIGANYDEAYRKKVTYTRCIIVSIYTMSPCYVFGGFYPKILFTPICKKFIISERL